MRFDRLPSLYVRMGLAVVILLFVSVPSFGCGGMIAAVIAGAIFIAFTSRDPLEAINQAFASHPWRFTAWLVVAGEGVGLMVAIYFAWRWSARLYTALPDPPPQFAAAPPNLPRRYAVLSLGAFLLLEGVLNTLSMPTAIKLAREARTVTGQIRGVYPQEHGTVTYTYTVSGRRFDTGGSPETLAGLHPGSSVQVYYASSKPGLSSLHEPQRKVFNTF